MSNATCDGEAYPYTGAGSTAMRVMTASISTVARFLAQTSTNFVIVANLDRVRR